MIAFDRRDEEPLIGFERGCQSLSKRNKRRGLIGLIGAIKSFQRVSKKLSNLSNLSKPCLIEGSGRIFDSRLIGLDGALIGFDREGFDNRLIACPLGGSDPVAPKAGREPSRTRASRIP